MALGSKDRLFQVSKICFLLAVSLPLLIKRLNVPFLVLVPVTSHLILSDEPDISNPFEPVIPVQAPSVAEV